uniref:MarR family transcriptional regulator n=1 Tax=Micromonospora carbonacea TaxID=47853 RepID=A0A7D5YBC9_9ACTN|nr:MarR family transcriptional regulator [Micromonospora carbonacea]
MRRDLLQTVVVKGIAETSAVADAADVPVADAEGVLADLAAAGLIRRRTGRLAGWTPTAEGRAQLVRLVRADPASRPPDTVHRDFVAVNADFKQVCTEWQRARPDVTAELTDRLTGVHDRVRPVIDACAAVQPRFAAYRRRLDTALRRFTGGDADALTGVRQGSYHGVWMELHADLLTSLDRPRTAQDGA